MCDLELEPEANLCQVRWTSSGRHQRGRRRTRSRIEMAPLLPWGERWMGNRNKRLGKTVVVDEVGKTSD